MAKSKSHQVAGSRSSRQPKKKAGESRRTGLSKVSRQKLDTLKPEPRDPAQMERKARRWAQSAHPNVVMQVRRLHRYERMPNAVSEAPYWTRLRESLAKLGAIRPSAKNKNPIDTAFLYEAVIQWGQIRGTWCYLVYSDGLAHGKLWARKHATAKELSRLKSRLRKDGWWHGVRNWEETGPAWTPAHSFLCTVRPDRKSVV